MPGTLSNYRSNSYSQHGQDGVLAEIFERLGISQGWFVDVGAWDGRKYSNTYKLLKSGWRGVAIEGDQKKFAGLQRTAAEVKGRLKTINTYVATEGSRKLDALLSSTRLPEKFEFLNIDIDSFDWWVWKSLKDYRAKVVAIEINSGIPPTLPFVQAADEYQGRSNNKGLAQGASFLATVELGHDKGYQLTCHAGDLLFVEKELVAKLNLPSAELNNPTSLFDDEFLLRALITPKSWLRIGAIKAKEKIGTFWR